MKIKLLIMGLFFALFLICAPETFAHDRGVHSGRGHSFGFQFYVPIAPIYPRYYPPAPIYYPPAPIYYPPQQQYFPQPTCGTYDIGGWYGPYGYQPNYQYTCR
ncbi:MAG: hypothetical protein WCT49_02125 [Candidatus Paceibacterota bacterium]|nr:hypothetical protein [Candidatus Paceibacterota bacterium]